MPLAAGTNEGGHYCQNQNSTNNSIELNLRFRLHSYCEVHPPHHPTTTNYLLLLLLYWAGSQQGPVCTTIQPQLVQYFLLFFLLRKVFKLQFKYKVTIISTIAQFFFTHTEINELVKISKTQEKGNHYKFINNMLSLNQQREVYRLY